MSKKEKLEFTPLKKEVIVIDSDDEGVSIDEEEDFLKEEVKLLSINGKSVHHVEPTKKPVTDLSLLCTICLFPLHCSTAHLKVGKPLVMDACMHVFHERCIKQWHLYKLSCPLCFK